VRFPLAWYLTWTTYATWLHGDERGSHTRSRYLQPDPGLEAEVRGELVEQPVYLSPAQRLIIEKTIPNECQSQGWTLHAVNARTNHVHAVISANRDGSFLRSRLKALTSAALSDDAQLPMAGSHGRRKWWTEKGNIVEVDSEKALDEIVIYVRDLQ